MAGADDLHGSRALPPRSVRLHLLGGFRVAIDGEPVDVSTWRSRKACTLLKLLALTPSHRLPRDRALDILWSDLAPSAAANNLRVTLHTARRDPSPMPLYSEGDMVALGPAATVWTDVAAFEEGAVAARRAHDPAAGWAAADLYAGDLLPEDAYEDWAASPREALRATYLGLLRALAEWEEARGERAAAIAALERLVAHEPSDETGHRALMRLHAETGRPREALRQYDRPRAALAAELDAEPEAATRRLARAIATGELTPTWPPPPPAARPPGNLPLPLTGFVGRERELTEVRRLLAGNRLLTLTGIGGVGKSRLALEVARTAPEDFPDGAWLVEVGVVADPARVAEAVARVLGVREEPEQPVTRTAVSWLAGRAGRNCSELGG